MVVIFFLAMARTSYRRRSVKRRAPRSARLKRRRSTRVGLKSRVRWRRYGRGRWRTSRYSRRVALQPMSLLSPCAKDYIEVLYNPFDPQLSGPPCLPDYRAIPSAKFYLRTRGTFAPQGVDGAAKLAYVIFNPLAPWNSYTQVDGHSSMPAVVASKNGALPKVGASTAMPNDSLIYFDESCVNIFYNDTSFRSDLWVDTFDLGEDAINYDGRYGGRNKFRVVGAGLRCQYTGQSDDRQGSFCAVRFPDNNPKTFARRFLKENTQCLSITFNDLLKYDEAQFGALGTGIIQVNYKPVDNDDFEYRFGARYNDSSPWFCDAGFMVIAISDCDPGSTFTFETITWYEAIGPDMKGQSPSHVDLAGLGVAQSYRERSHLSPAANAFAARGGMVARQLRRLVLLAYFS